MYEPNMSEEELRAFEEKCPTMSRDEVLALSNGKKILYIFLLQVKHKKLRTVGTELMRLLTPNNLIDIIPVIGATGVGKTKLATRLIKSLIEKYCIHDNKKPSTVPFVFIAPPANGDKSLSWSTVYKEAMRRTSEILPEYKQLNLIDDGIFTIMPRHYKTLAALRGALEAMFKHRKVRVVVIDEAVHLLRFGDYSAVMDTLKSLVDRTGVKLILLGSYDLFDLVTKYGQVARRTEILHFERYYKDEKDDAHEYSENIILKIQERWPCEEIPSFVTISDELMEASLGCIGLLKALMLQALSMQLEKKGKWDPMFMAKAAKSVKLLDSIRKEINDGEKKVQGATYGETLFSGKRLEDIVAKMSGELMHA